MNDEQGTLLHHFFTVLNMKYMLIQSHISVYHPDLIKVLEQIGKRYTFHTNVKLLDKC